MRKFHRKPLLGLIKRKLDHTFSNFGAACTACGGACGAANLTYGSAPGSYDGHPRADKFTRRISRKKKRGAAPPPRPAGR